MSISLPSGYTQIEYLQNTNQNNNAPYIATQYVPTTNTKVVLDVALNATTTASDFFGIINPPNSSFRFHIGVYQSKWHFGVGATSATATWKNFNSPALDVARHTLMLQGDGTCSVDSVTDKINPNNTGSYNIPFYIFARNRGSSADHGYIRLWSCKIYEGNTLTMNLVPCRDSNNVGYLYDTVGNQLYGNAGTGSFVLGPDVYVPPVISVTSSVLPLMYRRGVMMGGKKDYIVFADPVVEAICASTWGDGIGITKAQAAAVTNLSTTFRNNTNITSFDELRYFTGLTYIYGANVGGSLQGAFEGTTLQKITIPENVTTIRGGAFKNATALSELTILRTGTLTFSASSLTNVTTITRINTPSISAWLNITWNGNTGFVNSNHTLYINDVLAENIEIPSGISTIQKYSFYKVTSLTSIIIPSSVTTINALAFFGCTNVTSINTNNVVNATSVDMSAFRGMPLNGFTINATNVSFTSKDFISCATAGTLTINASNVAVTRYIDSYPHIVVNGNITLGSGSSVYTTYFIGATGSSKIESFRLNGNLTIPSTITSMIGINAATGNNLGNLNFVEFMGTITLSTGKLFYRDNNTSLGENAIIHLGYTQGIACAPDKIPASYNRIKKIYVGDGTSQAADQAVLDMYLADTDWAQYASKLDLWYNYSGEYKN